MSYRNAPKYKNTDVSASTVQNLLQTINSMSQRCRGQANTDDVLQRVRSIILMYRPHLANRIDLQLPELTMEALMPNSTNANQITHNFNYKYDYNTNVPPNAYNPFLPSSSPPQPPPSTQQQQQPPLQSFTFNAVPTNVPQGTQQQPPPPPAPLATETAPQTVVVTAPLTIEQSDLSSLNVLYVNAQRTPGVASYKQLLRYIVYLVRKYVRYEQITISLELVENFDTIQTNNDIAELLQCIERETNWVLPSGPSVCRWISILITSYCRIVTQITKREFVLSTIRTEERLRAVIADIETTVVDVINVPPPAPTPAPPVVIPKVEAYKDRQIETLTDTVDQQQIEITRLQTAQKSFQQQLDTAESKTLVLNSAFDKLRNYYRNNITSPSPQDEQELISNLIRYVDELKSSAQSTLSQQTQTLSEQSQAYQQLQQELAQTQIQYNKTIAELKQRNESYAAMTNLKLSSFEDAQSQLRAAQTKNEQLQTQIASLEESYKAFQTQSEERYKALDDNYNRLLNETKNLKRKSISVKPIRKVKAVPRRVETQNSKLIDEMQRLIQQHKVKNQQLIDMKQKYNQTIDTNTKMLEVIKNEALKTQSQVESLINNQAALSGQDFKALNEKSTQNLADRVSSLQAEKTAVREMCDEQLNKESAELQSRLQDSKNNLSSKIDKLMEQVAPLQDRIERSATEIEEFKTRIELMARKEAIRPTK
ncbi:desmoplakin [Spodoptera eridania nucleopolyhedrovirus]|uniref:Desmoplakin n=1 Tax=Spodoptera eridania nucleopolyhedrovirus TaxID=2315721 RepID=A0A346TQ30_9ABAC|nr:desmoplakin [Spodoptera eridania nucleopolyhedrovirus]AXU41690.1 desmoplakin [Spodoptera eridania nucleopolyhedrovirus]